MNCGLNFDSQQIKYDRAKCEPTDVHALHDAHRDQPEMIQN